MSDANSVSYLTPDWADSYPVDERFPGVAHLLKHVKTEHGLVAVAACGSKVRLSGQPSEGSKHKCRICLRIQRAAARKRDGGS